MTKSRPTYSIEFKNDAACLVLDKGYTITEACQAVGIGVTALRRWVNQLRIERNGITPNKSGVIGQKRMTMFLSKLLIF